MPAQHRVQDLVLPSVAAPLGHTLSGANKTENETTNDEVRLSEGLLLVQRHAMDASVGSADMAASIGRPGGQCEPVC